MDNNQYQQSVFYSDGFVRGGYNPVPCGNGKWRVVYIPLIPSMWHLDDVNEFWPDEAMAQIICRVRNRRLW